MAVSGSDNSHHIHQATGNTPAEGTKSNGNPTPNGISGHDVNVLCGTSKAPGSISQHASAAQTPTTVSQALSAQTAPAKQPTLDGHNVSSTKPATTDSVSHASTAIFSHGEQPQKTSNNFTANLQPKNSKEKAQCDEPIDLDLLASLFEGDNEVMELIHKEGDSATIQSLFANWLPDEHIETPYEHFLVIEHNLDSNNCSVSQVSDKYKNGMPLGTTLLNMKDWTLHGAAGTINKAHIQAIHQHLSVLGKNPPSSLTLVHYNSSNWGAFNSKMVSAIGLITEFKETKKEIEREKESNVRPKRVENQKSDKPFHVSPTRRHLKEHKQIQNDNKDSKSINSEIDTNEELHLDGERKLKGQKTKEQKEIRFEHREELDEVHKFDENAKLNKKKSKNQG